MRWYDDNRLVGISTVATGIKNFHCSSRARKLKELLSTGMLQ